VRLKVLDKIDRDMLRELQKNPTEAFLNVGKKIGISSPTIKRRFEALKNDGFITGSSILVDISKIGFKGKAFLFAKTTKNYDFKNIVVTIKKIPNIFLISSMIGHFDLLIMALIKNIEDVIKIVNQLKEIPTLSEVDWVFTTDKQFPYTNDYANMKLF
jgi:DNA-binding Lrp family transcriptional regulator